MENEYPKRKTTRLKGFDYSKLGAYFVTICIQDRKRILSEIIKTTAPNQPIGEGLTSPEMPDRLSLNQSVGEGLAPPVETNERHTYLVRLKPCGEIAEQQLKALETRYNNVTVDDYVIMPDHIHAVIIIHDKTKRTSVISTKREEQAPPLPQSVDGNIQQGAFITKPADSLPTLNDIVCVFKSLTARIYKQRFGIEKTFQRSYIDHIIRDHDDYITRRKYIYDNPQRWYYREHGSL